MKTSSLGLKKDSLEKLRSKIGQKVKLVAHTETRDSCLGNMNSISEPKKTDSEISITLLGIYGIDQEPIYIHGMNENGQALLFRNNINMWADENSGNPTHEDSTALIRVDEIDIEALFKNSLILLQNETNFKTKVQTAEPGEKYLAEKIIKGAPDYHGFYWTSFYCRFDDPKFIEKALTYLERII